VVATLAPTVRPKRKPVCVGLLDNVHVVEVDAGNAALQDGLEARLLQRMRKSGAQV
jgi:hypothetical protein